jgi:hypothetical protein
VADDNDVYSAWVDGMRAFLDPALWFRDPGYHDVFISHRFADSDAVRKVKAELEARQFSVYLDLDDPELEGKSDSEVAPILRKRMQRSGVILFVVSKNSVTSKWMPWELGYMDGANGNGIILRMTDDALQGIEGQEYLDRFPKVSRKQLVAKLERMEQAGAMPRRGVQPFVLPSDLDAFTRMAQWPFIYLQRLWVDPALRADVSEQMTRAGTASVHGTDVGRRMQQDRTALASNALTQRAPG